jgi:tRNA A-37 threonylcarbamoyl transferase component Bud32
MATQLPTLQSTPKLTGTKEIQTGLFGSSSGKRQFRVGITDSKGVTHLVAVKLSEPWFFSWLYTEAKGTDGTKYWVNNNSLLKRLSTSVAGVVVLIKHFEKLSQEVKKKNLSLYNQAAAAIANPPKPVESFSLSWLIYKCGADENFSVSSGQANRLFQGQFTDAQLEALIAKSKDPNLGPESHLICGRDNGLSRSILLGPKDLDGNRKRYLLLTHAKENPTWRDFLVGEGSFGKAKYALDMDTGEIKIVKVCRQDKMSEDGWSRLPDEIAAMRELQEKEGLVQLELAHLQPKFGHWKGDKWYMILENCDRGELFYFLHDKKKKLTPKETLTVAKDIAKALANLHEAGFTHRDLKEENVFLITDPTTREIRAKIGDFGCAKKENHAVPEINGTSDCWSPEKWQATASFSSENRAILHEKDDIWALGLILYSLFHPRHYEAFSKEMKEIRLEWENHPNARLATKLKMAAPKIAERPLLPDLSKHNPHIRALLKRIFKAEKERPSAAEILQALEVLAVPA